MRSLDDCAGIEGAGYTVRELFHPYRHNRPATFSLAHATVPEQTAPHRVNASEAWYVLGGEGEVHVNTESAAVRVGHVVYIPRNADRWVKSTGTEPLEWLSIVSPPLNEG